MREERMERRRKEKAEQVAYKLEREIAMWDPSQLKSATEDPFKTLFVARVVSATFSLPPHTGEHFSNSSLFLYACAITELRHIRIETAQRIRSVWTN